MRARTRGAGLALAALVVSAAALAQSVAAPGVHPISGRRYAGVMGVQGAAWLDRPERELEEEPDRALDAIGLEAGAVVADVGAGSGYFTIRMSRRVGPRGIVYAVDIQPGMLELLRRRMDAEGMTNVVPILGALDDPRLPVAALDLILMVDVYHEFSEPQRMLRRMRDALKPGGRLVLLEYRKEDPLVPIRFEHKMSVAEARMEVESEGFDLTRVESALPRQHILVFIKAKP